MKRLRNVIASGTFDRLHCGHRQFLEAAFEAAETVYCGLTDWPDYSSCPEKKLPFLIEDYQRRLKNLSKYLEKKNQQGRTKIFTLKDEFGPTLKNNDFDGIVVSQETLEAAERINHLRRKRALEPLAIVLSETFRDTQEKILSSSNIRLGKVDRAGINFTDFLPRKTLYLPQNQRRHFKKPLGALLTGPAVHLGWATLKAAAVIKKEKTPLVITVGDISTQAFLNRDIPFDLAIIDQKIQREEYPFLNRQLLVNRQVFQAQNWPGTISSSLTATLKTIFNQQATNSVLKIEGEEDLSVLPCLLLAPLETLIFYGQPFEGLVKIKVTEKAKAKVVKLLKRFIS